MRWLTLTAWLSLLVFAATSALGSVPLQHIGTDLQVGFAMRGALAPARSVVLALCTFLAGYLADRAGKRWFLSGGMWTVALALLWIARSSTYTGLVLGMMMVGAGLGCLEGLLSPLIAELHPQKVAVHMNVLHAFFPAGLVLSSTAIGRALDSGVRWRVPFSLAAFPAVLAGAMFVAGKYPSAAGQTQAEPLRVRGILAKPAFWPLAAVMALTAGCEGSLIIWCPSFIQSQYAASATVGAWGLTAFSAAMAVGRFGTAAVARFVPLSRLMVVVAFAGAGVTLCLAVAQNLWVSLGMLALAGLLTACFWPCILAIATRRIAAGSATLLAMLAVAGIVGFGVMPWAIGIVADWGGLRVGLGIVPVAFAASVVVLKRGSDPVLP